VGRIGLLVLRRLAVVGEGSVPFGDGRADAVVAANAIKRMGSSRDLYAAMAYLCGEAASWVTGQTLHVDGGADTR